MVQSSFAGSTYYTIQSPDDIYIDIKNWIEYTQETKEFINSQYEIVKSSRLYNSIDYDFLAIIDSTILYCDTILYDLNLVRKAMEQGCITEKEISLLRKIGQESLKLNHNYGLTYKSDTSWHDYENAEFEEVKEIYAKGRDFFATLMDADNVAARLKDYMGNGQIINNNLNIHGNVSSSQIQQGTSNSTQTMDVSNSFDYDRVLDALNRIKRVTSNEEFNVDFGDESLEVNKIVEETIEMVEKQKEPNEIKEHLNALKNLVIGVSESVLANGIYALITNLPIW